MSGEGKAVPSASSRVHLVDLTLYSYFNALLISGIAWFHTWVPWPSVSILNVEPYAIPMVVVQAVLVVAPFWCLGVVITLCSRSRWPGLLMISLAVFAYLLDLLVWVTFDGSIFETESWGLINDAVIWSLQNLTVSRLVGLATGFVVIFVTQIVMAVLSKGTGRALTSWQPFWRRTFPVALIILPLFFAYFGWFGVCNFHANLEHTFATEVSAKRDPISLLTRLFVRPELVRRNALAQVLVPRLPQLVKFEEDYRSLRVVETPKVRRDLVLVITECLRADGITPKSAPNLTAFANQSLRCTNHLSSGNCSGPGTFGLLFGVPSTCYPAGAVSGWPAAFPELLGQCGYHRVFLGAGDYSIYHDMRSWMSPGFEVFDEGISQPFHVRDAELIEAAMDVLNRRGPFAAKDDRPVFVVLYLYTTHFPNEAAAADFVFTEPGQAPDPPWSSPDEIRGYYLNSVHTIDRLLKPILESDAMVVVTGDHGQSFGEDGSVLHGGEITSVRSHTPFLISIPGEEPAEIDLITSHADLLPTVLDAMGAKVNAPHCLAGVSLLSTRDVAGQSRKGVIISNGTKCGWASGNGLAELSFEFPTAFRGDLWTGQVGIPVSSIQLFEDCLNELLPLRRTTTTEQGVEQLIALAQTGDARRRQRALLLLAAFPENVISSRDEIERLTQDANVDVSRLANELLSAIDDLVTAQ